MKKINFRFAPLLALLFFANSCETPLKVTTDYDKAVNFKQYKTFQIMQLDEKLKAISDLNRNRIIAAVKSEMVAKGFQEADNADLQIDIVTILKDKQSVTANTNYYGYGGAYRPYGWSGGMSSGYTTYDVQNYTDGSLIIDIIDPKTKQLIWEGIGNKEIDKPSSDPDKAISAAVKSIMAGFPPGATAKK